jgi:hypothetical protein
LASLWPENFLRLPRVAVSFTNSVTSAPNFIEVYALVLGLTGRWRVCVSGFLAHFQRNSQNLRSWYSTAQLGTSSNFEIVSVFVCVQWLQREGALCRIARP